MPRKTTGLLRAWLLRLHPVVAPAAVSRVDTFPRVDGPRGSRVVLGHRARLLADVGFFLESPRARVTVGDRTFIGRRSEIVCWDRVDIGADCAISFDVRILDTDSHPIDGQPFAAPVVIGDRVWIGAGAMILKGVTVGDGAVIGARSLVTRDVPAGALVVGSPARVVRTGVTWEL